MNLATLKKIQAENAQKPALAAAIAKEIRNYLAASRDNLEELRNWLGPHKTWPAITLEACAQDRSCTVLRGNFPTLHGRLRRYLSLSLSQDPLAWQLWKLDVAGNPQMWNAPFSPMMGRQEPLTPREKEIAQNVLLHFWEGTPEKSVIEDFMAILKRRIEFQKEMPVQRANDQRLLRAFEESRLHPTIEKRVEAAMMIADQGWDSFRRQRLYEFQLRNRIEVWRLVDQIRPLAYITDAIGVTPQKVSDAILKSINDVDQLDQKVQAAAMNADLKYLMDFHVFADLALENRPDLCSMANIVAKEIETQNRVDSLIITSLMSAPLLLLGPASLLPSLGARATVTGIGLAGSTAMTSQARSRADELFEMYLGEGKMDSDPSGWINSTTVAPAQIRAAASSLSFVLTLGLPTVRLSRLKNLN